MAEETADTLCTSTYPSSLRSGWAWSTLISRRSGLPLLSCGTLVTFLTRDTLQNTRTIYLHIFVNTRTHNQYVIAHWRTQRKNTLISHGQRSTQDTLENTDRLYTLILHGEAIGNQRDGSQGDQATYTKPRHSSCSSNHERSGRPQVPKRRLRVGGEGGRERERERKRERVLG